MKGAREAEPKWTIARKDKGCPKWIVSIPDNVRKSGFVTTLIRRLMRVYAVITKQKKEEINKIKKIIILIC